MSQILYNKAFNPALHSSNKDESLEFAIENDATSELILILPTEKLVQVYEKKLIRGYFAKYNKPINEFHVYTFKSFIAKIFFALFKEEDYQVITGAYGLLLFEEAANKAQLQYFLGSKSKLTSAVLEKLFAVVMGLRKEGIKANDINAELEGKGDNQDLIFDSIRLSDIASLLKQYRIALGDKYYDETRVLEEVNHYLTVKSSSKSLFDSIFPEVDISIHNTLKNIFPKAGLILFDGFSEFSLPENNFIYHLARINKAVAITIDFVEYEGPLFGNLAATRANIIKVGFSVTEESTPKVFDDSLKFWRRDASRVEYLRRWLFSAEEDIRSEKFSEFTTILSVEDKNKEVEAIAKLVRHLYFAKGIALKDICIVTRTPERYASLFRETFYQHKIPINVTDRFPLAESTVLNAILSVIELIIYGYRRIDLEKVLRNGYLKLIEDKTEAIDTDNLIKVAKKLRIKGGLKAGGKAFWESKLTSSALLLEKKLKYSASSNQAGDSYALKRDLQSIERALKDFKRINRAVKSPSKQLKSTEWRDFIVIEVIERYSIAQSIANTGYNIDSKAQKGTKYQAEWSAMQKEKESRALSSFLSVMDETAFILGDRYPSIKYTLKEYYSKLKVSVSGAKYQLREKQGKGVVFTSIEQTRWIDYRASILCGAIDGVFPLPYRVESFLGKELEGSEQKHISAEKTLFYQFLTNAEDLLNAGDKSLFIFHALEGNNGENIRSSFIDSLLKITTLEADGKIIDLNTAKQDHKYAKKCQVAWINSITSETEKIVHYNSKA